LAILREQIKDIEQARLQHLADTPQSAPNTTVRLLASVIGLGVETAYLLVQEVFRMTSATARPSPAMPGSPVRQTKAGRNDAKKACPRQAMPACVVA
jgi:transposase